MCSVSGCKQVAHTQTSAQITASMIRERLGGDVQENSPHIALCNSHYTSYYGKNVCGMCRTRLMGQQRSSPNFPVISKTLKEKGMNLKEEDKYCKTCYTAQLKLIQLSESLPASTDNQLRVLISATEQDPYPSGSVEAALASTTVMVAKCLLSNESLLLRTTYDYFKACLNREEKTHDGFSHIW